jgi:hypothetical protein
MNLSRGRNKPSSQGGAVEEDAVAKPQNYAGALQEVGRRTQALRRAITSMCRIHPES